MFSERSKKGFVQVIRIPRVQRGPCLFVAAPPLAGPSRSFCLFGTHAATQTEARDLCAALGKLVRQFGRLGGLDLTHATGRACSAIARREEAWFWRHFGIPSWARRELYGPRSFCRGGRSVWALPLRLCLMWDAWRRSTEFKARTADEAEEGGRHAGIF